MKRARSIMIPAAIATAMLCIILDSKTAIHAASDAIDLCIRSVIPSLFPLLVLSSMLVSSLSGIKISLLSPIRKICRIPEGSEAILLTGLLGGYPLGAKCLSDMFKKGQISKEDAERMLGFCSNAGPSFIFGICPLMFSSSYAPWFLWTIQIISALITGILLPGRSKDHIKLNKRPIISISSALYSGTKTIALICCWVILFRILISFIRSWFLWLLPDPFIIIIEGLLELTNGCLDLSVIQSEQLRFVICSGLLSFGGLCVLLQTASVTSELGLGKYIPGKIVQSAISISLAASLCMIRVFSLKMIFTVIFSVVVIGIFLRYLRKRVAFSTCVMYNGQKEL